MSAKIDGFRLLCGAEVAFETSTTVIAGRNNSGKTSFVEVFYKFLGAELGHFSLDDFALKNLDQLVNAGADWKTSMERRSDGLVGDAEAFEAAAVSKLPSISLELEFAYDEADDLSPISKLILDLDPARHDALLVCNFGIARPHEFLRAFHDSSFEDIILFARKRMTFFERSFAAVDKNDRDNRTELKPSDVRRALRCSFIYAQNLFDDTSLDTGHGLSKGFEAYFKAIADSDGTVDNLEVALSDVATKLDGEYDSLFSSVFEDLRVFGAGRMPSLQDVKVISEFRPAELLRGSTKVTYTHETGPSLPEAHNGLGFSKLIFIVLQFVAFFEQHQKAQPRPGMQLLFLEEPEAHLHPQMQAVFVKNINEYLGSKAGWNVQLVLTTHSSHIVAEGGFSALRYFDSQSGSLEVKNLSEFHELLEPSPRTPLPNEGARKQRDESPRADGIQFVKTATEKNATLRFLEQYMELQRCDIFFADKVILVEGLTERLLLPEMIRRLGGDLKYEYVSVITVGGAYALKFRELLKFLAVKTLIVTDLDSAEPKGRHKKAPTNTPGAVTTNATLKHWLPGYTLINDLQLAKSDEKQDEVIRVAYQVPENGRTEVGRSFEEAFILANAEAFASAEGLASENAFKNDLGERLSVDEIREDSYEVAHRISSKSDFAFDILTLGQWNLPHYIEEGLKWLAPQSE
ncbi:AAA family ATPase [Timonella senegalensis]|uniref:AAA family ATPase n=1 Tax=Timonella senegalensis TaxID=1465825 RepID=UPI0028B111A5|nr:AAA family ATPase [Timonella senegalensis]